MFLCVLLSSHLSLFWSLFFIFVLFFFCFFFLFFRFLFCFFFFFFFFFQAEDGIRDRTVTGVQTCALPISFPMDHDGFMPFQNNYWLWKAIGFGGLAVFQLRWIVQWIYSEAHKERSEERRVGKECRSRWST